MNKILKVVCKGSFWNFLPWRKPSLADLPLAERRRAKALMLGACSGARPAQGEKTLIVHIEHDDGSERTHE